MWAKSKNIGNILLFSVSIIMSLLIFYSLNNKVGIDPESWFHIELDRSKSERELEERQYVILTMFQQIGIVLTLFFIPLGFTVFHNRVVINKLKSKIDAVAKKHKEKQRKSFSEQLITAYPILSANDVKLCIMLNKNLTSKEIAIKLNISSASVNTARYRLRKKMNIPSDMEISVFLRKF